MWLLLKLIIMAVAFILRCLRKSFSLNSSSTEVRTVHDIPVTITKIKGKHDLRKTLFSIPIKLPHFILTRETEMDGVFKSLGFAEEFQTGDRHFDKRIYLACDHPVLHEFFRDDQKSRVLIATLFSHLCTSISSVGKDLILEFKGEVPEYGAILDSFTNLSLQFAQVDAKSYSRIKDPFTWKVLIIEAGVWSLLSYGYFSFMEYYIYEEDTYLEVFPLVKQGIWFGLAIAIALLMIIFFVLKGSSRGHRIILESIFVLGLAVPTSGISLVSDLNIHLDSRAGSIVEAKVINCFERSHRRKNSTYYTYHMVVEPLPSVETFNIPREISVTREVFNTLQTNGIVALEIGQGYLRHPWLKSIRMASYSH